MNKLNKKECDEALTRLLRPYFAKADVQNVYHNINRGYSIEEDSNLLTLLIIRHFDNPPLKFEELEVTKWYWDNKICDYIQIELILKDKKLLCCDGFHRKFEENRFFRKQVEE